MYGQMHPNVVLATILLAHQAYACSPFIISLYSMITHNPLVADNLPIKTLVARQWPNDYVISMTQVWVSQASCAYGSTTLHNILCAD